MRSRIVAVAAIFLGTAALSTTGAAAATVDGPTTSSTPQATQGGPPAIAASCGGAPWGHRALIKNASIKKDYYNASPSLVSLSYGTEVGWHDTAENKYGNKWHEVSYSTRTADYCGWMSDNWIE